MHELRQQLLSGNVTKADRMHGELARSGHFPQPNIFKLVPWSAIKLLLGPSNKEQELYEQMLDIMKEVGATIIMHAEQVSSGLQGVFPTGAYLGVKLLRRLTNTFLSHK